MNAKRKTKPKPEVPDDGDVAIDNDTFDRAFVEVIEDLESGEIYREEMEKMKACGIDPHKPIELTFKDGTKMSVIPHDSVKHLKPKK